MAYQTVSPLNPILKFQMLKIRSASQEASVSSSSICSYLAILTDLHEDINNLIQLPSLQQAHADENCTSELLNGSLKLFDICGIARDVAILAKESVQELQSSLRRKRGIDADINSRKNIDKMVRKCIKNLKSYEQSNKDTSLKEITSMLKEAQAIGFSILKSALVTFWSLVSKFSRSSHVHLQSEEDLFAMNINKLGKDIDGLCVQSITKQLKDSEMTIQELEENLEALFWSLVKTRVSLLNVLNH